MCFVVAAHPCISCLSFGVTLSLNLPALTLTKLITPLTKLCAPQKILCNVHASAQEAKEKEVLEQPTPCVPCEVSLSAVMQRILAEEMPALSDAPKWMSKLYATVDHQEVAHCKCLCGTFYYYYYY